MSIAVNILAFASLIFTEPKAFPDLALECGALESAVAEPVSMPRARAYVLATATGGCRVEDRFNVMDLWYAEAVRGCWRDESGSQFMLCRMPKKMPGVSPDAKFTRKEFAVRINAALGPKDLEALDAAVYYVAPVETFGRKKPDRALRRNLSVLWQYETTNANAQVFAFMPRTPRGVKADWYVVSLVSDDPEAVEKFDAWLDGVSWSAGENPDEKAERAVPSEVDLLASDYRRNVVNYSDWHFACASNVVMVDNIPGRDRTGFAASVTNSLVKMQSAYRAMLPSPLEDDSHVAAVRVFATKDEYLDYIGHKHEWSAAIWSPLHRELVLWYPLDGVETLLGTVWHEALHQHLSYACGMQRVAPWFNEGHAELFRNSHFGPGGELVFDYDKRAGELVRSDLKAFAEFIPELMAMDYEEFYAGSREDVRLKYALAWSIAYFLEKGAPKVRFEPFKNLRKDALKAYAEGLSAGTGVGASSGVSVEMTEKLVAEWLAFWK